MCYRNISPVLLHSQTLKIGKALILMLPLVLSAVSVSNVKASESNDGEIERKNLSMVCTQDKQSGLLNCDSGVPFNARTAPENKSVYRNESQELVKKKPRLQQQAINRDRPRVSAEICSRQQTGVTNATVCASSILAPQSGNRYVVANLFDDNSRTAWVEDAGGNGIGEYLSVEFDTPQTLRSVLLINGYTKSMRAFTRNSRIKMLRLTASNGKQVGVQLQDSQEWQTISLTGFEQVNWIQLHVESVYPGSRYQDTALTELRLR